MFRPQMLAIFRLYNENLSVIYTCEISHLRLPPATYTPLSHTPGSCCCFRPGNGFSSTRHRDLHPLRVSSVQFVLSFGRGGERAESVLTCTVALVLVSTFSSTSSRATTPRMEPARLRGIQRGQTVFEARGSCYDDASSAVGGGKQKALVECTTRATLPRGVSGNWDRQANSCCSRRQCYCMYILLVAC